MIHYEDSKISNKNWWSQSKLSKYYSCRIPDNSDINSSCFIREKLIKDVTSLLARNMDNYSNSIPAWNSKVSDDALLDTKTNLVNSFWDFLNIKNVHLNTKYKVVKK